MSVQPEITTMIAGIMTMAITEDDATDQETVLFMKEAETLNLEGSTNQ